MYYLFIIVAIVLIDWYIDNINAKLKKQINIEIAKKLFEEFNDI